MNKKCWIDDPSVLIESMDIFPNKNSSDEEKINSLTRLVLLTVILMHVLKYKYKKIFFVISFIMILLLYLFNCKKTREHFEMDSAPVYKYPLIAQNKLSNEKMSLPPIQYPRSHDREVWSFPSYKHSAVNYKNAGYDISNQYQPVPDKIDYQERDYRLASYTDFSLQPFAQYADISNNKNNKTVGSLPPRTTPVSEVIPSDVSKGSVSQGVTPITSEGKVAQGVGSITGMGKDETVLKERFGDIGAYGDTMAYGSYNGNPIRPNYDQVNIFKADSKNLPEYPPSDLLIPKDTNSLYGPGMVTVNERTKYLENIEPNMYSYSDVSYPINNNLGISFTPEIPPVVLDQVATPYGTYPLYHRIDPQLIRAEGLPPERRNELPYRNDWSAKYSGLQAAPGSVNYEDIYDPRFNGYGDGTRSYVDAGGQVQYYYSDIDAYRNPNFGIRSKVDFIDFTDPMGRVIPEYQRSVGIEDVKQQVEQQWDADQTYFREGLMERLMRKRDSETWQLRARPMSKGQNTSTFTSAR